MDDTALDHLVLAAPDLAEAVDWFTGATGVVPVRGGSHPGRGSANHLVGLGDGAYLEIIGPDPQQPDPPQPRPFGLDTLRERRLVTWAVRTADIDAVIARARAGGYDPGDPEAMSRATPDGDLLQWRLTAPDVGYGDGLVPFLIDWGTGPHPTSRELPRVRLLSLRAVHPDPSSVRPALAALHADLHLDFGERPAILAVVEGAHGAVAL